MPRNPKETARRKRQNNIVAISKEARLDLFDEMKKKLPNFIKKRKKEFIEDLEKYEIAKRNDVEDGSIIINNNKLDLMEVTEYCFSPIVRLIGGNPTYSPEQLDLVFDYYRYCTLEINKKFPYTPNKEDYCRLLGISTTTFDEFRNSASMEIRDLSFKIKDWISSVVSQNAFQEKVDKNYAIFYQKAALGRRDNDPIQVNNYTQNNTILPSTEFGQLLEHYSSELNKKNDKESE